MNNFEHQGNSVFGEKPEHMLREEFKRQGNIGFDLSKDEMKELGFTDEAVKSLIDQGLLASVGEETYSPTEKFYEST